MNAEISFISELGWLPHDCVAVMGSGGKSTLIKKIAQEAVSYRWPVVITTTTHIHIPFYAAHETRVHLDHAMSWNELQHAAQANPCIAISSIHHQKATGIPSEWITPWLGQGLVLIESDGSKERPWKIPGPWEPVVPQVTTKAIIIVGLSCLGKPLITHWIHRLALLYQRNSYPMHPTITPKLVVEILCDPGYYQTKIPQSCPIDVYLAACTSSQEYHFALEIASELQAHQWSGRVFTGNIGEKSWICRLTTE